MAGEQQSSSDPQNILSVWLKSASDFWGSMLQVWSTEQPADDSAAGNDFSGKKRRHESVETVLKSWQALSSIAGDPGGLDAVLNLSQTTPDILLKMIKSSWSSYYSFQQQWLESAGRIGQKSKAYSFEQLDKESIRAWSELYDKEFSQFLHIPQLGLTRFHQEKMNQLVDQNNRFQAAMNEFLYLFYLPMEKSLKILHEELTDQLEEGKLSENYNEHYKRWIKILEGHYMALFKSPEYLEAMNRTLNSLEDLLSTRDAISQDMMKLLAMPTQNDMDDLYREIYHLKKRIRQLEKDRK